jgi:regulator of protease activity HflC (stomatin/prohibitin superfamily)
MTTFLIVAAAVFFILILSGFITVNLGYVAVITVFGKYSRIMGPGLNYRIPIIEVVYKKISIQNR